MCKKTPRGAGTHEGNTGHTGARARAGNWITRYMYEAGRNYLDHRLNCFHEWDFASSEFAR